MRPRLEQLQQRLADPEALHRGIAQRAAAPEERALTAGAGDAEASDSSVAPGEDDAGAAAAVAALAAPRLSEDVFRDPDRGRPVSPKQAERRRRRFARRGIPTVESLTRFGTRLRRVIADIEYFTGAPLGWREGAIVVWAGMRGAVTVAAAQSLPHETPGRSVLVLIAFLVAAGSLLLQGGTLGLVLRLVKPAGADPQSERDERRRLMEMLYEAGKTVPLPTTTDRTAEAFAEHKAARLARLRAQRDALLDARDDGTFSADVLAGALSNLDADEISIDLKGDPTEATG